MVFVIYWAVIFTYTDFFWFQPWESSELVRQLSLWLCLIGWITASIGTPLTLFAISAGSLKALTFLPITALWWPASVLISQVVVFTTTGESYLNYLFVYPIFILTDIAIPIFLLIKWSRIKEFLVLHEGASL
ncbi:MAG: hypothetical protein EBX92_06635 [Actinobacteria bacterium]|nr:hypothetical protein [Actinomycetota bacterium]